MANHKHKANYKSSRSCGLCKPHKRLGNSQEATKPKYRSAMEPKKDSEPAVVRPPVYVEPEEL